MAGSNSYDVIVIGGGHNGLVNAAYLQRAGKKVLVLERRPARGGVRVRALSCQLAVDRRH